MKTRQMVLINFFLLLMAKLAILFFSYKTLARYFGPPCNILSASTLLSKLEYHQALRIRRSIMLAVKYTPWHCNCLTRALLAKFWCQRLHLPYLFFIGLPKTSSLKYLQKEAHAWVMAGPIALTGDNGLQTHSVISTYSNAFSFHI